MCEILSFSNPDVKKLEIERNQDTGFLEATVYLLDSENEYVVKLIRPSDIDILTELFEAKSIWATKTTDAQLEYGMYDFFIMNDGTFDCSVDSIEFKIIS